MGYEDLVIQYNNLEEEEKNLLLVYKSRLGLVINSLENMPGGYIQDIYTQYKQLLDAPQNLFMKYTVFKDISFDSYERFIASLKTVRKRLKQVVSKLVLKEDITVYRAVSIKEGETLEFISKSPLLSTSIDISTCDCFFISNSKDTYYHYLYQINLNQGDLVAVCPYSILLDSKNNRLILTTKKEQKEIMIWKDNYHFTEKLSTVVKLNNDENLNIIVMDATCRKNNIKKVSK